MKILHSFPLRLQALAIGALLSAAGLAANTASADSPSADPPSSENDRSNGSSSSDEADEDHANADSSAARRRQDRDRTTIRDRQNGEASNPSQSRRSANYRSERSDSDREDVGDSNRYDDANASQRQAGHNQNQRQRFGVIWADDDDHWRIDEVTRGGVAARAGLRPDDEVLSLNGRQIGSSRDFQRYLNSNQRVPLVISRDGRRQTIWLGGNAQGSGQQLARNQYQQGQSQQSYSQDAGQGQDAQAFLGVQLNDQYQNMAVVKQAFQNSPAQRAGLQPGDTITSINGQRISSPQQLTDEVQQLQPGATVQVQFSRPQARTVQIRLGGRTEASQASYPSREQRRSDNRDSSDDDGSTQSKDDESQDSQGRSHDSEDHHEDQDAGQHGDR